MQSDESVANISDGNEGAGASLSTLRMAPKALKPPVEESTLTHKQFVRGPFWQRIPAYTKISEEQFLDHRWQAKNTITNVPKLLAAVQGLVSTEFYQDAEAGFRHSPMSVRVSPYLLSLIDWADPYKDPLRRQFIPLNSRLLPDHPKLGLDSLGEMADAPVPGLTHRYVDKALFLPLDTCPVYCRFCTRSYAVGVDTEEVEKVQLNVNAERWQQAFDYIVSRPELEDIVISGGDAYNLRASQLTQIGMTLLEMPNVKRMRFATKGPAVMPQKLLTDHEWLDALTERGGSGPQDAQGRGLAHALQPPQRDHGHHARWRTAMNKLLFERVGSRCATRACCKAGRQRRQWTP